jgi:TonB family protein
MKRILPIVLFSCILNFAALAQKPKKDAAQPDSVAFYMSNSHTMAHNQTDAQFLRLIIKTKGGLFEVQNYYPDGVLRLLAKTTLQQVDFEQGAQGTCTEYYRNGNKHIVRKYDEGALVGDDSTFYANGQLFNVVSHTKTGYFFKRCLDTLGKVIADKGNGVWINRDEDDQQQTLTGPIVNGRENGLWIQKYTGDTVAYKVEFKDGIVVPGRDFRQVGQIFSSVDVQPSFGSNDPEFGRYLSRAIKYPAYAREHNITGRVILTFIVEKDGTLTDIKVLKSPHESLSAEAVRMLKASPRWRPGMMNGKPVRVQFSVPVSFALSNE